MCIRAQSLQSCLTLCDPMDCSPPGSSVHGDSPGKNIGVCYQASPYHTLNFFLRVLFPKTPKTSCIHFNFPLIFFILKNNQIWDKITFSSLKIHFHSHTLFSYLILLKTYILLYLHTEIFLLFLYNFSDIYLYIFQSLTLKP